ncbi:class I glutamine amidotransferase-like protein [Mycena metata]|uniref:Class I glutamine amidotransferase-like protein n=1 Tax=Mycena metata TaxID=1033252 RepID=A0AAD7MQ48_9AGAR|nr:class I glutamine amidotransferase-like protein [Mycena metata]
MPQILSIAVCISDEVTLSDFVPPVEILSHLNLADHPRYSADMGEVPYRVAIDYVAPTMDPVVSISGRVAPTVNPTITYADALASGKQFDILWVPAGPMDYVTGEKKTPQVEIDFIAKQAPGAKYVMSVCGGAYQLALAGTLSGRRATTNKSVYRDIVAATPKDIQWVAKARWIVDGKFWTSSGVSAGADMALAFVEHLTDAKVARFVRGGIEIPEVADQDDPFAAFYGLV